MYVMFVEYLDQAVGLDFVHVNTPEQHSPIHMIYKASIFNQGKNFKIAEVNLNTLYYF